MRSDVDFSQPATPRRRRHILSFGTALLLLAFTGGCRWSEPGAETLTPAQLSVSGALLAQAGAGPAAPETSEATALIDAAGRDFAEARVIRAYQRVAPSVVSITTQVVRYSFFDVYTQEGTGSGFVLDEQGHILTNYHVIEGAERVEVGFGDEAGVAARLVGTDPRNDLAVLKVEVEPELLHPVELGDSDALQVGQRAIAIGNPFGEFSRTLTTGVISALGRSLASPDGLEMSGIVQTDASINRGNSGGPLLDSSGRVIGVSTAIFSPSGTSAGVGFAIPVNTVKRVLPDLLELGRYRHPWLGIGPNSAYSIVPRLAELLGLSVDSGLLLVNVQGPLAEASVRGADRQLIIGNSLIYAGGDILTRVDDQPVEDYNSLQVYLETHYRVGDTVRVTILRGNQRRDLRLTLAEDPSG